MNYISNNNEYPNSLKRIDIDHMFHKAVPCISMLYVPWEGYNFEDVMWANPNVVVSFNNTESQTELHDSLHFLPFVSVSSLRKGLEIICVLWQGIAWILWERHRGNI